MELPLGYQMVAKFTVRSNEDYTNAFKELELFDKKQKDKKFLRDYNFKILSYENVSIDDYGSVVIGRNLNGTNIFGWKIVGSHQEEKEVWTNLSLFDFRKNDVSIIGIFTEVKKNDHVEWIPNLFGVRVE